MNETPHQRRARLAMERQRDRVWATMADNVVRPGGDFATGLTNTIEAFHDAEPQDMRAPRPAVGNERRIVHRMGCAPYVETAPQPPAPLPDPPPRWVWLAVALTAIAALVGFGFLTAAAIPR